MSQAVENVVTIELLEEFMGRWNRYDVDGILDLMTDDVVFDTSSGPDVDGKRFVGREQAGQAIRRVIASLPEYEFTDVTAFVHGDRAVAEWTMTHTAPDGSRVSVRGCDLFELRDGRISRKDSYRKHRPGAEYRTKS